MDKELALKLLELAVKNEGASNKLPFEIGKCYFIRTATLYCTGRVKEINGKFLTMEDGAWIVDCGRFNEFISTGLADEVEPVSCLMYVNTDSICDAFLWNHKLPREVK